MKFARLALLLITPLARTSAAESAAPEKDTPVPAATVAAPAAKPSAAPKRPATTPASATAKKSAPAPTVASRENVRDSFNLAELREKAASGNAIAQYNLGLVYAEGRGVPADPAEAYAWLTLAAEKGSTGKAYERLLGSMSNAQMAAGNKRLAYARDPVAAAAADAAEARAKAELAPPPKAAPVAPAPKAPELKVPEPAAPVAKAASAPAVFEPTTEEMVPLFRPTKSAADVGAPAAPAVESTVIGASLSRPSGTTAGSAGAGGASAAGAQGGASGTPGNKGATAPGAKGAPGTVAAAGEPGAEAPPAGEAASDTPPAAAGLQLKANVSPEAAQRQIEKMAARINEKGLLPAGDSPRARDPAKQAPPRNRIDLDPDAQPAATGDDAKPDKGSAHLMAEIEKGQAAATQKTVSAAGGASAEPAAGGAASSTASRTSGTSAKGAASATVSRSTSSGSGKISGGGSSSSAAGSSSGSNSSSAVKPAALVRAEVALAAQSRDLASARAEAEKTRYALATERTRAANLAEEQRRTAATIARLSAERDALALRVNQSSASAPSPAPAPLFTPTPRPAADLAPVSADRETLNARLAQTESALSSEISARTEALRSAQSATAELAAARARIDDLTARATGPGSATDPEAPRFRSELAELRAQLDRTTTSLIARLEQTEAATFATASTQSKTGAQLAELRAQLASATAQAAASTNAATTSATALADALAKVDSLAGEKIRTADTLVQLRAQMLALETSLAAEKNKAAELAAATAAKDDTVARLLAEKAELTARLAKSAAPANTSASVWEEALARDLAAARQESAAREAELFALRRELAAVREKNSALAVDSAGAGETAKPLAAAAPTGAQATEAARSHTIVDGDTLTRIALRYYGNASRWPEIFAANRDVLRSERDLIAGRVLRIP